MDKSEWRRLPKHEKDRLRALKHERRRKERASGNRRRSKKTAKMSPQPKPDGCLAGTELKKLFSRLGFQERKNCGCAKHASQMDRNGCDWCEQNIDRIAGWIKYECKKRGIPFVRAVAVTVIRLAIRRARRKAESR